MDNEEQNIINIRRKAKDSESIKQILEGSPISRSECVKTWILFVLK